MPVAYGGLTGTLQSAAAADGNGTAFDVKGAARVTVQVSGTFTATVTFEGTVNNDTWVALSVGTSAAFGTRVTTATRPRTLMVVSLPFPAGENRMVAVKIVDDRGIESLKVMRLDASTQGGQ